jgi:hypothetical protein
MLRLIISHVCRSFSECFGQRGESAWISRLADPLQQQGGYLLCAHL